MLSQCWMRLFLWFSNTVPEVAYEFHWALLQFLPTSENGSGSAWGIGTPPKIQILSADFHWRKRIKRDWCKLKVNRSDERHSKVISRFLGRRFQTAGKYRILHFTHCLKIIRNVSFEFYNFRFLKTHQNGKF